mmetsp:Transcript_32804/g.68816  ORF Transcript_32804/g.68816 Transcript_32804/m.68816 type:complete len:222 (+) Transcript_32804:1589-2254(+)
MGYFIMTHCSAVNLMSKVGSTLGNNLVSFVFDMTSGAVVAVVAFVVVADDGGGHEDTTATASDCMDGTTSVVDLSLTCFIVFVTTTEVVSIAVVVVVVEGGGEGNAVDSVGGSTVDCGGTTTAVVVAVDVAVVVVVLPLTSFGCSSFRKTFNVISTARLSSTFFHFTLPRDDDGMVPIPPWLLSSLSSTSSHSRKRRFWAMDDVTIVLASCSFSFKLLALA